MAFLEAQKLVKEYNRRGKTFRAVDDIDFTIEPGDFVMIEGESGSGKTTFLNLLTGLTDPTSGAVIIDGRSLKETGDKEISKIRNQKIKYIPQGESLLSALSVRDNIEQLEEMLSWNKASITWVNMSVKRFFRSEE